MSSLKSFQGTKSWIDFVTVAFCLVCVAGCFLLLWSASDWYALMSGNRLEASFCAINSYWNCDRASLSAMGAWGPVPVGIFGAAWFFVVGFLGLSSERLALILRILLGLGVVAAVVFGSYLFFVLKTGCIVCVASYLLIFLAALFGFMLSRRSGSLISDGQSLAIIGLLLLVHILYTWQSVRSLDGGMSLDEFPAWWQQFEVVSAPSVQSPVSWGPEDAKIRIIEFSDFGCPYCGLAAGTMGPYLKAQPNVRLEYFPFPLDGLCNPSARRSGSGLGCEWSKVTLCAVEQEKAWTVHTEVFLRTARQEPMVPVTDQLLASWGLNANQIRECLAKPETDKLLLDLVQAGIQLDVQSTPTFWVNGRILRGYLRLPLVRRLVSELQ
jgi:protein-disulfide isomerase/uncharacterized membrane protein